jgi:hypothetical protein
MVEALHWTRQVGYFAFAICAVPAFRWIGWHADVGPLVTLWLAGCLFGSSSAWHAQWWMNKWNKP